jgi:nicotinate phosphoribosyltransferase
MQQAVLKHYPDVQASYRFTHRDKSRTFSRACFERFQESVRRACAFPLAR